MQLEGLDFSLTPASGVLVQGTITDRATNAPIVGAKVILYGGGIAEVQTDGNGAYSVTGQQYPYTGPATMFVIAHGYFSIFNGVDIANPFPMVVDRTLLPGGPVIAGRIVDATTNQPIANASLNYGGCRGCNTIPWGATVKTTTSDLSGNYAFDSSEFLEAAATAGTTGGMTVSSQPGFFTTQIAITAMPPFPFIQDVALTPTGVTTETTIDTQPSGLAVDVDSVGYIAPQTFTWVPGTVHTIATVNSQSGVPGTTYIFVNWGDGGALQHMIAAPALDTTIIANFAIADTTAPVIAPQISGTQGQNSWYTSQVTVSWMVTDPQSAITAQTGCDTATVSVETAGDTFTCTATSAGGTESQTLTVKLDLNPPSLTCPADVNVIEGHPIVLGTPAVSDTMDPNPVVVNDAPAGFPAGTTTVTWTARDAAGNQATCSQNVTVILDATPPAITPSVSGTTGAGGWYVSPATVSWTVTDNESAVTSKTGCEPITVSTETTGQTFTCSATSTGGSASESVTVKLDLNPPSLTCPANVTVTQGQAVNLGTPTVSDTMDPNPAVTNNAPGSYPVGTTTVTWTATDAAGRTSTCAQTVTVNAAVNHPPVANNDAFTLAHAGTTPVIVPAPGVLSNDTDADGNALSVVGATASTPRTIALNNSGGTVALYRDGHFVYTPPSATFSGSRNFTYQVSDGQATSNTATVTLTIRVNTAPVARNETVTTGLGQAISINVLANDTDAQSNIDPSSVAIGTPPTNGSTTLNANGTVVYTPAAGFAGTDTFTYTVKDSLGATSNAATVTVYVPGAVDDSYTATANNNATQTVSVSTANGVRANDPPTGAAGRTITLVSGPTRTSGTGTATMALTLNANGSFSLTLTAPASATTAAQRRDAKRGTYQFTYTMTLNGVTTAPATATITVQ